MLILVHRQEDERRGEAEFTRRPRHRETVLERHRQIEHCHVKGRVLQTRERLFAVGGFGDDFESRVGLDDLAQTLAEDRVIVGNENTNRVIHCGVTPVATCLSIQSSP